MTESDISPITHSLWLVLRAEYIYPATPSGNGITIAAQRPANGRPLRVDGIIMDMRITDAGNPDGEIHALIFDCRDKNGTVSLRVANRVISHLRCRGHYAELRYAPNPAVWLIMPDAPDNLRKPPKHTMHNKVSQVAN